MIGSANIPVAPYTVKRVTCMLAIAINHCISLSVIFAGHNGPVDNRLWTALICTCLLAAGLIGYYVAGDDVRSKVINGVVCAVVTGVLFGAWRVYR